ncbi:MAG: hypothetical protein GF311_15045 [Candidatus Lokiarchaeota archaeon]|nr:hypothetical protein [Candidatus Lokiarchaeota archaeon]
MKNTIIKYKFQEVLFGMKGNLNNNYQLELETTFTFSFSSGISFYKLTAGEETFVKRMILLK